MTEQTEPGKAVEQIVPAYAATMPTPQGGALPTGLEWQALERMANTLADSDVIPYRLKRKPADVAVILLAAREYGIPPLMALSKLPVVNGTPAPMGELMVALVLRAGHRITATFRNPDGTVYAGGTITAEHYGEARYRRRDWTEDEVLRFTIAEAVAGGLMRFEQGKPFARDNKGEPLPWELWTPNMARWRAVANACRIAFADVLMGLSYLPEELGAIVNEDGAPIEGEVVGPRGGVPTGNLEQRTAQEAADKLAEQPWHDGVIEALRKTAAEGGYLDVFVSYVGERMTFAEALTRHVEDRKHADTVDAEVVEEPETPPAPQEPAQEAPAAVPATEEPAAGPVAPENAPAPVVEQGTGQTLPEAAAEVATEALTSADVEFVRSLYRGSGDLLTVDVAGTVTAEDVTALGLPDDALAVPVPLGSLLLKVGDYVGRHGNAVREAYAPGPDDVALPLEGDTPDPWANGQSMGTPPATD